MGGVGRTIRLAANFGGENALRLRRRMRRQVDGDAGERVAAQEHGRGELRWRRRLVVL